MEAVMNLRLSAVTNLAALAMLASTSPVRVGAGDARAQTGALKPFAVALIQFEHNATDGDFEVVLEAKGGDEGLNKFTVTAPNGRKIVDLTAPDAATLGLRQVRLESPEPKDAKAIQAAYPEGAYTFAGTSVTGVRF